MTKKTITILLCSFISVTLVLIGLYATTYKIVHKENSFFREYQKGTAIKSKALDVKYNSYYIAGISNSHIYLGNIMAAFHMLVVNLDLTDTLHVELNINGLEEGTKIHPRTTVKIDSPYFYIADGTMPGLFRGNIGQWEAERFVYGSAYFTKLIPISASSFAISTKASSTFENVLGKMQTNDPYLLLRPNLLEKQVDGLFCTEGDLLYNEKLQRLIYTYRYRNGYVVYDTNLNLDYRGHTIDTFRMSQVKVGYIEADRARVLTYSKYVNRLSSSSGHYLFINSDLRAKNDEKDISDKMSVIDVYDLKTDTYKFSFKIENHNSLQLSEFAVFNSEVLVAIYGHYVVIYNLNQQFF